MRKSHSYKLRDGMGDTPGKTNACSSKLRALLEFAIERDWITNKPVAGVPRPAWQHPAHHARPRLRR
jgi:hypothetical protein